MRMTSVAILVIFFSKVSFRKYLITAMFKVLSQHLRGIFTTAFERHLIIEYFTDIDQRMCQTCTKTFNLLYASLSLKQAYFLNLTQFWSNDSCHNLFTFLPFDILCIFFIRASKIFIRLNAVFCEGS